MDTKTIIKLKNSLDSIVQQASELKIEFWYARYIMHALGYDRWENFSKVVQKASVACETAGSSVANHFRDATKMVKIG